MSSKLKRKGGVSIGKQERFSERRYRTDSPGPGNYQHSRPSSAKNSKFSKNTRNCTEISHIGEPGRKILINSAGSYSKVSLFEDGVHHNKGFSLGIKP